MKSAEPNKTKLSLEVRGFILNCFIEGKGPNALIIGSSKHHPKLFSENLKTYLRCIFVDHRGFGTPLDGIQNDNFSINNLVEDIEVLRETLGIKRFILIGHAESGYIATEYAKKYPENITHLIILNMSPNTSHKTLLAAERYLTESVCPKRKEYLSQTMVNIEYNAPTYNDKQYIARHLKNSPVIWADYRFDSNYLWKDINIIQQGFDLMINQEFSTIDLGNNSDKITMPIFLGLGRYDYWNPPHLWESLRNKFDDLNIRIFEKSGHYPMFEEKDLFDTELVKWLKEKIPITKPHN